MRRLGCVLGALWALPLVGACVETDCARTDPFCRPALLLRSPAPVVEVAFSRFVFTVTSGDNFIRGFRIDQGTGALTLVSSLATNPATATISMSRHPTLPVLLAPQNVPNDGVRSFRYDAETAALTFVNNQATGNQNSHYAFALPDGQHVLFNSVQSGGMTHYYYATIASDGTMGAPGPAKNQDLPSNCQSLRVHPSGKFFYTDNCPGGGIHRFSIDASGNVTNLGTTVYNGTDSLGRAQFDSMGRMYVVSNTGRVVSFTVDANTGDLSVVSNIATGQAGANTVVVHPAGSRLYVLFPDTGQVKEYSIGGDATLTFLREEVVLPVAQQYDSACIDAGGKFIFANRANASGAIQTVRIADGSLSMGSNLASGNIVRDCVTTREVEIMYP